eukprot:TRINITY_DN24077_c0_g1_i2.p1 TRINITY_DN24077_c0_g1~~TRINITY_DN24077_c0_g1_i2.p1  ORF type:complete len:459 (-),score=63.68 TRINITY_DN24077_c0_g1_i2:238-1539(-)
MAAAPLENVDPWELLAKLTSAPERAVADKDARAAGVADLPAQMDAAAVAVTDIGGVEGVDNDSFEDGTLLTALMTHPMISSLLHEEPELDDVGEATHGFMLPAQNTRGNRFQMENVGRGGTQAYYAKNEVPEVPWHKSRPECYNGMDYAESEVPEVSWHKSRPERYSGMDYVAGPECYSGMDYVASARSTMFFSTTPASSQTPEVRQKFHLAPAFDASRQAFPQKNYPTRATAFEVHASQTSPEFRQSLSLASALDDSYHAYNQNFTTRVKAFEVHARQNSRAELSLPSRVRTKKPLKRGTQRTTVVLQNVPKTYNTSMVVNLIHSVGFKGRCDFVDMPVHRVSPSTGSFAIVNLVSPEDVPLFWKTLEGFTQWKCKSKNKCRVVWYEQLQGLDEIIHCYKNLLEVPKDIPDACKPRLLSNGVPMSFHSVPWN